MLGIAPPRGCRSSATRTIGVFVATKHSFRSTGCEAAAPARRRPSAFLLSTLALLACCGLFNSAAAQTCTVSGSSTVTLTTGSCAIAPNTTLKSCGPRDHERTNRHQQRHDKPVQRRQHRWSRRDQRHHHFRFRIEHQRQLGHRRFGANRRSDHFPERIGHQPAVRRRRHRTARRRRGPRRTAEPYHRHRSCGEHEWRRRHVAGKATGGGIITLNSGIVINFAAGGGGNTGLWATGAGSQIVAIGTNLNMIGGGGGDIGVAQTPAPTSRSSAVPSMFRATAAAKPDSWRAAPAAASTRPVSP